MTPRTQFIHTVIMAIALLGVLAILFAGYKFIEATNTLARGERVVAELETMDAEQQQAVISSLGPAYLIEQREASQNRNGSLIIGGVGLVALGAAWFGYDLLNRRARTSDA